MRSTTDTGRAAERLVALQLRKQGCKLLALNWRTRRCEIDIVAHKNSTVYFVEVKYRTSSQWGTGFEYISPKKVSQMHYAALTWAARHGWHGDVQLLAAEVDATRHIEIRELIY